MESQQKKLSSDSWRKALPGLGPEDCPLKGGQGVGSLNKKKLSSDSFFVEIEGLEPSLTEPESVVLPLHHISMSPYLRTAKIQLF